MTQQKVELRKRELEQSLMQEQNPSKKVVLDMDKILELNQNFFWDNNVNSQKIIPKKEMRKSRNSKNYSPTKVKTRNFLTTISYNCLKNIDFNIALFIIDCYTNILFN